MPRGRPTKLNQVIDRVEGQDVTVADTILKHLRRGSFLETAAGCAGIDRRTVQDWLKEGARLAALEMAGTLGPLSKLTAQQRRLLDFHHAAGQAMAESVATKVGVLDQLAQGGLPIEVRTERVTAEGTVVTVRTERTLPDGQSARWMLERGPASSLYSQHSRLEVTGKDGGPIDVQVRADDIYAVIEGVVLDLGHQLDTHVREVMARHLFAMAQRYDELDAAREQLPQLALPPALEPAP
jgi:hypothetical protein